jgi:hypothetical protein
VRLIGPYNNIRGNQRINIRINQPLLTAFVVFALVLTALVLTAFVVFTLALVLTALTLVLTALVLIAFPCPYRPCQRIVSPCSLTLWPGLQN